MSSPGILTTARLVCKDTASRTRVIAAFEKIIAYTQPHEPNVLQYICCLPVEDKLGTEIYMIEEYTDQAASDAHLATSPVQELIKLFSTTDVLAGPPEVHNCPIVHKAVNGNVAKVEEDPAIVLAETKYETGGVRDRLDGWSGVAQTSVQDGSGCSAFLVTEDKENTSVRTQYIFKEWASHEAWRKSDVVTAHEQGSRRSTEDVRIKAIAGFLGRSGQSKL